MTFYIHYTSVLTLHNLNFFFRLSFKENFQMAKNCLKIDNSNRYILYKYFSPQPFLILFLNAYQAISMYIIYVIYWKNNIFPVFPSKLTLKALLTRDCPFSLMVKKGINSSLPHNVVRCELLHFMLILFSSRV